MDQILAPYHINTHNIIIKKTSTKNCAGRQKVQPLLRADADGGKFIRHDNGVRCGRAVHEPSSEGDVAAFPVPERRHFRAAEAELPAVRGARQHQIRPYERRNAEAQILGAKPETTESIPSNGRHDGARSMEASTRLARALRRHFEGLALRAFSQPVRPSFLYRP